MSKIIVINKSSLPDYKAVEIVGDVIAQGRISNDGKNYCYLSIYRTGKTKTRVYARRNVKSDTFQVWDEKPNSVQ